MMLHLIQLLCLASSALALCGQHGSFNASVPTIAVFATGGTIASKAGKATDTTNYAVGIGIGALIDAVPSICTIANVAGTQVANIDSGSINSTLLIDLASQVAAVAEDPEISGIVITHGTDTLEETAFFLALVIESTKPIVVTGAMRPATAISADGPMNLYQAATLAVSAESQNRGVMVVLNDRIGSAYTAVKNNANTLDTFLATEQGQLGAFINQVPKFYSSPAVPRNKLHFDLVNKLTLPQVDILYGHQDSNSHLIQASAISGTSGIVFAGVGAGGWSVEGIEVAEKVHNDTGIPMVYSHRTADGFAGGDQLRPFQITSGFLNPQKARIMLQLAIDAGYNQTMIRHLFESQ